jgi:Glycosyl hydrolase family 20, catalytic domain
MSAPYLIFGFTNYVLCVCVCVCCVVVCVWLLSVCGFFLLLARQDTWLDFYRNDPTSALRDLPSASVQNLLLGGEACMWSEQINDRSVDTRLWPRTAAIAERLWSAQSVTDEMGLCRNTTTTLGVDTLSRTAVLTDSCVLRVCVCCVLRMHVCVCVCVCVCCVYVG